MIQIKKVLFPTDFTEVSQAIYSKAVAFAKSFDAELHVLHTSLIPYNENTGILTQELYNKFEPYQTSDVKTIFSVVTGKSAAYEILHYESHHKVDIIVMGTHARTGIKHALLGSVTERVLRLAKAPVLTLRAELEITDLDFRNILVPVDFSSHSKSALLFSKHFAEKFGSRLDVFHVFNDPNRHQFIDGAYTEAFTVENNLVERLKGTLSELYTEVKGPETPATFNVDTASSTTDIAHYAIRKKSDLIIISTHGYTEFKHLLLGSTAEKVTRLVDCPVLVLKPFGRQLI